MMYLSEPGPCPKPAKAIRDTQLLKDVHSVRPICQRCGASATSNHRLGRLQVAHIVSRGRRGDDVFSNVIVLCHDCHMIDDHDKGLLSDDKKRRLKAHDESIRATWYRDMELAAFGEVRWALAD